MRISSSSITAIQKVITGDPLEDQKQPIAPYRTMGGIIAFFGNAPGVNTDGGGETTRCRYVEAALTELNSSEPLKRVVEAAVSPAAFLRSEYAADEAVDYLNDYLIYDGYRLRRAGHGFKVEEADDPDLVDLSVAASPLDVLSGSAIRQGLDKARDRLDGGDFDGAITAARTLLETVLLTLHHRLSGTEEKFQGDLLKLYKAVQRDLNLDPKEHDAESLKKILRGATSIVDGLGSLRNRMGDAHASAFTAHRHHAVLAINAVSTVSSFLFSTQGYQQALARPSAGSSEE